MLQSLNGEVSPILDSLPRASNRRAWRRETGVILEALAEFVNHHITPQNIMSFEVFGKAVLVAKHLITGSCLLPRSLLFDACGNVSDFNAVPLKGDRVSNLFLSNA